MRSFRRPGNFNPRTPCGVRRDLPSAARRMAHFNPRTPCGVRPWRFPAVPRAARFQSTHPLRGATRSQRGIAVCLFISIHAPLAGCDTVLLRVCLTFLHFNPRTPCGVRRKSGKYTHQIRYYFNPRTPCGVRPLTVAPANSPRKISIHAPLAGCDGANLSIAQDGTYFNPRTPCGVRRYAIDFRQTSQRISIHAPLAGCDWDSEAYRQRVEISIHAPLAGCDSKNVQRKLHFF